MNFPRPGVIRQRKIAKSIRSPTAAAGGLNSDPVACTQAGAELSRHRLDRSAAADNARPARCAVDAAVQSPRREHTSVGKQGYFAISQHFYLTDNSIAAAIFSASAAARPKRILPHPQRIGVFESFGGGVQRIRHVRADACNSGLSRPRAHAACDGFIVSEGIAGAGIDATDG